MIKNAKKIVALTLVWVFMFSMVPTKQIYANQFNVSMVTDFMDSYLNLEAEQAEGNLTVDSNTSTIEEAMEESDSVSDNIVMPEEETLEPIEINDTNSDVLEQEVLELEINENIINETIIYDAQPSSIEEVQAAIDAYEALPWNESVKPHWQYEVNSGIMPSGWRCELVDYDEEFGADYYTFFPAPVVMSLNVWDGTIANSFAGGSGTEDDPYLISDGSQMAYLAKIVNSGTNYSDKYFKLTGNIDLNNIGWTPIGTNSSKYFGGNFDGNGYEVKGLYINSTNYYQGLFGYVKSPYFKNIGVVDSEVSGSNYVGGIAGYVSGSVSNCYNTGTVTGREYIGGIAGYVSNSVTDSYNTGTVTGSGYIGGVAGYVSNSITDSYNTGKVTGSGSYTGGVAGFVYNGPISNCHNTNDISGASSTGGVIGYFNGSSTGSQMMNCYNEGDTVTGISQAGGISQVGGVLGGSNYSPSIENCYNKAEVTGDSYVSGISWKAAIVTGCNNSGNITAASGNYTAGIVGNAGSVSDSHNTGNITGGISRYIGGIAGHVTNSVTNCDNTGSVIGFGGCQVGGIVGYVNNGPIINCYNANNVSGTSTTGGIVGYFAGSSSGSQIMNCYNEGETVTGTSQVGGLIGGAIYGPSIENCYNKSEVKGDSYVSGISYKGSAVTGCYNIGNITATSGDYAAGIVGSASSVTDSYNTGNIAGGGNYVGGVASSVGGSVSNCYNTGTVTGETRTGGVVGTVGGLLTDSYNTGKVTGSGSEVGSVAGQAGNSVINCYNTNNVSGMSLTGGIVGYFAGSSSVNQVNQIINCYNEGETVIGTSQVGGIIGGANYSPSIENCYNKAEVTGDSYVSGITYKGSTVTGCHNSGNITAVSGMYTAGIVGTVSSVSDSYNTGDITGGGYVGGIAGYVSSSVTDCYNTGSVVGLGTYEVGGIAGRVNNGPIINCYNTNNVSGTSITGGVVGYFLGSSTGSQIINCYNEGETVTGTSQVGGIIGGANYSPSIENCYNKAEVKGDSYVSGISYKGSTVTGCYNSGNITAASGDYAAGIVGNASSVTNSYNTGNITGGGNYVGGIAGSLGSGGANACANLGDVKGMGYVGGIVGYGNSTSFFNCYNMGSVSGGGTTGGIVGYSITSSIKNCYNAGDISGQGFTGSLLGNYTGSTSIINSYYLIGTASDGVGNGNLENKGIYVTSAELKALAPVLGESYTDDINNVNQGYPILVGLDYSAYIPDEPVEQWIYLNIKSESDGDLGIYINFTESGGSAVILNDEEQQATLLTLVDGKWTAMSPVTRGASMVYNYSYKDYKLKFSSQSVELNKLDILNDIRPYIVNKLAEMYDYKNFTLADYYYINKGISNSIGDNLFSSQVGLKSSKPTENLMYARAKMITDACFYQAYAFQAGMSREETINSIENANCQWYFTYATNAVQSNSRDFGLTLLGGVYVLGFVITAIITVSSAAWLYYEASASKVTLMDSVSTVISNEGSGSIAVDVLGNRVTVDGIDYECDIAASAFILDIDRYKDNTYFVACLYNSNVYVGPGISEDIAKIIMLADVIDVGVFTIYGEDAKALVNEIGPYVHNNAHGDSGYFRHYHLLNKNGTQKHAHLWYWVEK